jgi:hypothetical protein
MFRSVTEIADRQQHVGAAVVMPTLLRPTLLQAVRSIFAQDFPDRIQILLGIDKAEGDLALVDTLRAECPAHIALDLFDPGYSTSVRHGGVHPNRCSGSLRTVLTYAANSRHVAYLDDDNWWAPDHLSALAAAVREHDWSWSYRWFVELDGDEPICADEWESVGPDAGMFKDKFGGFVDPSSLMIDKLACPDVPALWSLTPFADGRGSDRLVFDRLSGAYRGNGTGRPSSYYRINPADTLHMTRLHNIRLKGAVLPSDRRRGVTPLAEIVAPWHDPSAPLDEPDRAMPANSTLSELLRLLKPKEMIVLGAGDGGVGITLARTARSIGLDDVVIALLGCTASPTRIARSDVAALLSVLPAELADPVGYLVDRGAAVDLVQLGPDITGSNAWQAAWPLLRIGGFMLASGQPDADLEQFVETTGSSMLRVDFPGSGPHWVLEKGLASPIQADPVRAAR